MLPAHYEKKENNYFCRFSFGQFFFLLVLEIVTLFFVFYLGARYGGELLGVRNPISVTKKNLPQVTNTEGVHVVTTADPEIKAIAKDLLDSSPTPDLKKRISEMLEKSHSEKPAAPVVTNIPDSQPATPPSNETVIPTIPAGGKFTIQAGSYTNVDEAHSMLAHWKGKGYSAYLVSADIPDKGRWYRVRLGTFENKEEAEQFVTVFKAKEGVDAFVSAKE